MLHRARDGETRRGTAAVNSIAVKSKISEKTGFCFFLFQRYLLSLRNGKLATEGLIGTKMDFPEIGNTTIEDPFVAPLIYSIKEFLLLSLLTFC